MRGVIDEVDNTHGQVHPLTLVDDWTSLAIFAFSSAISFLTDGMHLINSCTG